MPALRCTFCLTNWPNEEENYQPCPICQSETRKSNEDAIPADRALSKKRHADFERWLEANGRLTETERLERAVSA